ncbi:MAG TPA: hypothetical protein VE955_08105 [Candidatus Dormibacteraeota bacterium]|nr:hypothetical protein [Candidatus Dormibacteraeota bacterium]
MRFLAKLGTFFQSINLKIGSGRLEYIMEMNHVVEEYVSRCNCSTLSTAANQLLDRFKDGSVQEL